MYFRMMFCVFFGLISLNLPTWAEQSSQKILQSWGFEQDDDGRLKFTQKQSNKNDQFWQPDYSVFEKPISADTKNQINPVVIKAGQ